MLFIPKISETFFVQGRPQNAYCFQMELHLESIYKGQLILNENQ